MEDTSLQPLLEMGQPFLCDYGKGDNICTLLRRVENRAYNDKRSTKRVIPVVIAGRILCVAHKDTSSLQVFEAETISIKFCGD